jgi:hypothetical protein
MLEGGAHQGPHQQDREREYQRLGKQPGKTEVSAAPAVLDLAHEQGAPDALLDSPRSPQIRQLSPLSQIAVVGAVAILTRRSSGKKLSYGW